MLGPTRLEGKTSFLVRVMSPHLGHIFCSRPEGQAGKPNLSSCGCSGPLKTHLFTPLCPQAMESKLLIGGRNIMDHTNEQQKMLELKRQEIAEQVGLGGCMALRSGLGG